MLNDVKHTSRYLSAHTVNKKKGWSLASYRQSRPLCRINLYNDSTKQGCQTCVDTRNDFDACRWRMLVVSEVEYWCKRLDDQPIFSSLLFAMCGKASCIIFPVGFCIQQCWMHGSRPFCRSLKPGREGF